MAGGGALPPDALLGESAEPPWGRLGVSPVGPPGSPGGGANPFSFKEFVRSKQRKAASASRLGAQDGGPQESWESSLFPDESSSSAESPGLGNDLWEPFFADPTVSGSLLHGDDDDDDDWSSTYQPSAVEEAHLARAPSASLSSSALDSSYCNLSDLQMSSPEQPGRSDRISCGSLGEGGQSPPGDQMSPEDGFRRLLQLHYEELKEENSKLRSKISQIQAVSESQAERMRHLERTLEKNKRKEEKEAHELEAMVQQVEENLQLMTKRALKAENSAIKLKRENAHLQVQVETYKLENIALRSGHLENLAVVKQNADVALQNLLAVMSKSKSSIKQLVSGAEELQLVADLLKSIDKISEIPSQGTP